MVAVFTAFVFFLSGSGGGSGFMHFYDEWLNIPGFEAWKFINLAIFLAIMIYLAKKPLSDAFKAKREEIRADLIKAEAEKQAALAKLTAAEGKLAQAENEKAQILQRAKDEAAAEIKRDNENSNIEIERLRRQSEIELARLTGQSRAELRRFSAEESVRLAEEKLRSMIDSENDARLVKASINEIGGLN
jgi:F-type H+-transporting ATPase subunit b